MLLNCRDLEISYDMEEGVVNSLRLKGVERLTAPSELFRVCLRDVDGVEHRISSREATSVQQSADGGVFTGFDVGVEVRVSIREENGDAALRICVIPKDKTVFAEWVDLPVLTLPALEKNNGDGTGGKILVPYNEGVLISDIEERDNSGFGYQEPSYPARGRFYVFPNMMCAQMIAYLWEDAGLYVGAHDSERGVKEMNFVSCAGGVEIRMRLYCGADFGARFKTEYPVILSATEGKWEAAAERYRSWFLFHNSAQVS